MLVLALIGCTFTSLYMTQPDEFVLPGVIEGAVVEVIDDGDLLTIRRRALPISNPVRPLIVLLPLLTVTMGVLLLRTRHRIAGASIIVVSVGSAVWAGMSSREVSLVTLDRAAGLISIHIHPMIGRNPAPVLLPFSEVDRVGLALIPTDGPSWVALDLTTQDSVRYSVDVSTAIQPGGMAFSEALRDHVAHAAHIDNIEETHQRWRYGEVGETIPETL
ncbi:MAG: hypothetical protein P8R54_30880 [Myxococcota bacterium]|nr:hypothetical protein [Myxococcota bacterium]